MPRALVEPAHEIGADVVLQSVAARDQGRAADFATQYGFARHARDYEALISDPEIDLVYIALPVDRHCQWALRALAAGKHVLCEKPFAMNTGQAEAAVVAAAVSGRRLVEAFHYRYHPAFQLMLDWLRAGRIGAVRSVEACFNTPIAARDGAEIRHRLECGGGAFMDLGCYPLSWALMIFGEAPIEVAASAIQTSSGVDEALSAALVFASGARAALSASMAMDQVTQARLHIKGDEGVIDFINPVAPHLGAALSISSHGSVESAGIERASTYLHQLRSVLRALHDGSKLPTEADAIVRQQRTLDQIYAAAGLGHLRFGGR